VAFCRNCGKPLCDQCKRAAQGTIFCAEHAPAIEATATATAGSIPSPPPSPTPYGTNPGVSPGLAAFLGFIPGVGAIYNGQYAKGLVHAVVFGLIISIMSSGAGRGHEEGAMPILAFFLVGWIFYMVFEAYHTARKRMLGEPVEEFSSLINVRANSRFPTGALALIVLGVILLLNTLDILDFRYIARYWPVVLILAGVYMLWARLSAESPLRRQEARDGHE